MGESIQREGVDLLYSPGERVFALAAPMILAMGWSIYPQERGGKRRPGRAGGKSIQWGRLCETAVGDDEFSVWRRDCSQLNVACAFGPASGHTFTLDIDCLDPQRSRSVQDIARTVLGYTPFLRIGRAPKAALIYRAMPGAMPRSISVRFADADGSASEDGMEILSKGKSLTIHGLHHVTGRWFQWPDANPLTSSPMDAPLVTEADLARFMTAVEAVHPLHAARSAGNLLVSAGEWAQATDAGGLRVPILGEGSVSGLAMDSEGRVRDGREGWLKDIVYHVLTGNRAALLKAKSDSEEAWREFLAKATHATCGLFADTSVMDSKWRRNIEGDARNKVIHLAEKIVANPGDFPAQGGAGRIGFRLLPVAGGNAVSPDLSWLRQTPRTAVRGWHEPPGPDAASFPIQDREPVAQAVGDGIEHALDVFLNEANSVGMQPRLHVLHAPTGGGKTSRTLRRLAADPRTYLPDTSGRRRPYVMLLPTYGNIEELRQRALVLGLDGNLDDAGLAEAAQALGLLKEGEIGARVSELRRDAIGASAIAEGAGDANGFRTAIYSGKVKAGCIFPEKVELAMSAGIGASAFCRAVVQKDGGVREEEVCPHYDNCGAIRQRDLALDAHVVFMPHSFLALKLPDELLDVRAVIADERVHHLFLHVAELGAGTLKSARRPPRLTKAEVATGMDASEFLADRANACGTVLGALARGECPAEALLAMASPKNERLKGIALVESALRVCGDGVRRDGSISPSTSFEAVRSYCTRPVGREIREELQFWRIILERMQSLVFDRTFTPEERLARVRADLEGMPEGAERTRSERSLALLERVGSRARGSRDMRIQAVDSSEGGERAERIRISWRTRPNWDGVPTLLLDASAAPDVVAKIWGIPRDRVVVHGVLPDFGKALNVRVVAVVDSTYSASSLAARADSTPEVQAAAAARLARVRDALSAVCATHADGRVVAGSSILLREAIEDSWAPPANLDWCHYGAMRGLDGFKFHGAAVSVGRMELPVRTIDGLVAALTYDDPDPEDPFDIHGNGSTLDEEGGMAALRLPMAPRAIRMRNGGTAWLEVPCYPGRWAALMQRQYREEELLQFVGRLRPIYREGRPPVWYALTSVIPEGIVVDDILHLDDMLGGVPRGPLLWNAARRCGGILSARLAVIKCPDLFRTVEVAEEAMRTAGLEADGAVQSSAAQRGWSAWKPWHALSEDGQDTEGALVAPWATQGMQDAMSDVLFRPTVQAPEVQVPTIGDAFLALACPRPPDAVEDRLGSVSERAEREDSIIAQVASHAFNGNMDKAGRIEWGGKMLTPAEACAARSLANAWRRRSSPPPRPTLREGEDTPSWEEISFGTLPGVWTA